MPEKFASYAEALGWFSAEHQVLLAVADAAAAAGDDACAWQLPALLTDYLNREGHWHDLAALGRAALAAAEQAGDGLGRAHAHASIGVANLRVGCYGTARSHLLRASSLFREAGATAWQARNHLTVGVLFDRQGRHDKARRQAERALSLYQDLGYRAGEAHALENLGWHLAMLGSGQAAVRTAAGRSTCTARSATWSARPMPGTISATPCTWSATTPRPSPATAAR